MIRPATAADLPAVVSIYEEVIAWEAQNQRFTDWREGVYPALPHAQKALEESALFVEETDGALTAAVILNQHQLPEYDKIPWTYPAPPEGVWVIHTLCVRPCLAGQGIARRLVDFCEGMAQGMGGLVMRLDTFVGNAPAITMYPKLGYHCAGQAVFDFLDGATKTLVCYEKAL